MTISGIEINANAASNACIRAFRTSYMAISNCRLIGISRTLTGVWAKDNAYVYVGGTYFCDLGAAIQSTYMANVLSQNNTGDNNNLALQVSQGGTIVKSGTQPTATTAESISSGGVII